jgi:UDP-glucuronate 4-epimerase
MTILVTGGAGFIGYHVAKHLLSNTIHHVVIVDDLNDYYSVSLKKARLEDLKKSKDTSHRLSYFQIDVANFEALRAVFASNTFDVVVHLAAQAGVRHAKSNPGAYITSNILGFFNVLECVKKYDVRLMLYASSSSVYGSRSDGIAFNENMPCESPLSLYAATKLSDELLAKAYSLMCKTRFVGMRFFNVYGPWGRPDMAYFSWATALKKGESITIHGDGKMLRDMTYIDDVVEVIDRLMEADARTEGKWLKELTLSTPYRTHTIFNVGNSQPVVIQHVFDFLSSKIAPAQAIINTAKGPEEAFITHADTSKLRNAIGFSPSTNVDHGLAQFVNWFNHYNYI